MMTASQPHALVATTWFGARAPTGDTRRPTLARFVTREGTGALTRVDTASSTRAADDSAGGAHATGRHYLGVVWLGAAIVMVLLLEGRRRQRRRRDPPRA